MITQFELELYHCTMPAWAFSAQCITPTWGCPRKERERAIVSMIVPSL